MLPVQAVGVRGGVRPTLRLQLMKVKLQLRLRLKLKPRLWPDCGLRKLMLSLGMMLAV
jgi:hypothetical protein